MAEARPALDEDRLKQLVRELETVVRRELPWYEGNEQDPGITLLELFVFVGDTLSEYQARAADDTYLRSHRTWGLILHNVLGTAHRDYRLAAGATAVTGGARGPGTYQLRAGKAIVARLPGPLARRATINPQSAESSRLPDALERNGLEFLRCKVFFGNC